MIYRSTPSIPGPKPLPSESDTTVCGAGSPSDLRVLLAQFPHTSTVVDDRSLKTEQTRGANVIYSNTQ